MSLPEIERVVSERLCTHGFYRLTHRASACAWPSCESADSRPRHLDRDHFRWKTPAPWGSFGGFSPVSPPLR
jgi:hypothetical protein